MFSFSIQSKLKNTLARVGTFETPYSSLQMPELAIVATEGEFKAIPKEYWQELPCKYVIVNTFHISTKKPRDAENPATILERIDEVSGIHSYMNLKDRTIASDSGGFQVFSLGFGKAHQVGKIGGMFPGQDVEHHDQNNPVVINNDGVTFEFDNRKIHLNPEKSMDIQHKIGADIMFAFDECTSPLNSKEYTKEALQRTYAWLDRCIEAHKGHEQTQALFAIVQGGAYEDLRKEAATIIGSKDVPGFGIGGSLGKTKQDMYQILEWVMPILPEEKPKHLLGIGSVKDIFEGVERGIDLFDCVIPTREARHRQLYTSKGRLALRKMKTVQEVLDPTCSCFACRDKVTYAQLWQLFLQKDPKATCYASSHNIWFFSMLMERIRESIKNNTFFELKQECLANY
ncbi:MAG TPA: tRNA guanosine(34) transglycosylase Tgt [Candidatus Woesebacteria bacterium]|nr:tRNA guanosine(34) transglycosylase Tgt [Candidatus Woesebacteria bacterium]